MSPPKIDTQNHSKLEIPASGFKDFIIRLAQQHNISYAPTFSDHWAEAVTKLSDDDVQMDDIERLAVALKRADIITGREMGALLVGYLREERYKNRSPTPDGLPDIPTKDVKNYVIDLARRLNITHTQTQGDVWAEAVTKLSGDDVHIDGIEQLIHALQRAGAIDSTTAFHLFNNYLDEEDAKAQKPLASSSKPTFE